MTCRTPKIQLLVDVIYPLDVIHPVPCHPPGENIVIGNQFKRKYSTVQHAFLWSRNLSTRSGYVNYDVNIQSSESDMQTPVLLIDILMDTFGIPQNSQLKLKV